MLGTLQLLRIKCGRRVLVLSLGLTSGMSDRMAYGRCTAGCSPHPSQRCQSLLHSSACSRSQGGLAHTTGRACPTASSPSSRPMTCMKELFWCWYISRMICHPFHTCIWQPNTDFQFFSLALAMTSRACSIDSNTNFDLEDFSSALSASA